MAKDAQITVGADASEIVRVAAIASATWNDAAKGISGAFASAARSVVMSLGEVALAQGRVNFSSQREQVVQFEAATTRMAMAMGRNWETVREKLRAIGPEIGKRPGEVAEWASSVGRLTYNFDGAVDAMKGMQGLATSTNRSVEDYRGLAVTLGTVGHVAGDTTHALGVMAQQAEDMGTSGGIAAFADQIGNLQEVISHFGTSSEGEFLRITAAMAVMTKGMSPQMASRAQQGLLGSVAGDPLRWSRFTHSTTDKVMDDPIGTLKNIAGEFKARFGKDATKMAQMNLGYEGGKALMGADWKAIDAEAKANPSKKPEEILKKFHLTPAGQREVTESKLDVAAGKLVDSSSLLGKAADALQKFAAAHPVASTAVATVATTLATMVGGSVVKAITGFFAGGAATAAAGAATTAATGTGLTVAAQATDVFGTAATEAVATIGASAALAVAGITAVVAGGVGGIYLAHQWSKEQDKRQESDNLWETSADKAQAQLRTQRARQSNAALGRMQFGEGELKGKVVNAAAVIGGTGQKVTPELLMKELAKGGMDPALIKMIGEQFERSLAKQPIKIINLSDAVITTDGMHESMSTGDQR